MQHTGPASAIVETLLQLGRGMCPFDDIRGCGLLVWDGSQVREVRYDNEPHVDHWSGVLALQNERQAIATVTRLGASTGDNTDTRHVICAACRGVPGEHDAGIVQVVDWNGNIITSIDSENPSFDNYWSFGMMPWTPGA
jgi:hypothetical protein